MIRVAAIDRGTNSLRMLVSELDGDAQHDLPYLVADIGRGSTELASDTEGGESAGSLDGAACGSPNGISAPAHRIGRMSRPLGRMSKRRWPARRCPSRSPAV